MGERKVARLHIRAWAGILAAGLVTLFIMPPAPAGAAEAQLRVDAASRGGLTLTVYNRDLALISDRRSVDLPAGEARLVFEAVSPKLQADSLLVSGVGFRVLEQSFVFDLLSPRRLLETAVGKQVRVVKVHPQTGAETLVPARLLSVAEGVVLQIGERIETGEAGRLVFESVPEGLGAEPVLTALVASQVGGRRDLVLRYLTTGLSWQADYVAELSADEARLDLSALVTLTNASGLAYPAATLRLVAGEVRKERPPAVPRGRMVMAAEMSRGQGGDLQEQPAAADQHVYELGRPVNLADRETKQVALLSSRGVPVAKTYRFERLVNALGGPDEIGPAQATVELTFRNDAASGLDRPPAGRRHAGLSAGRRGRGAGVHRREPDRPHRRGTGGEPGDRQGLRRHRQRPAHGLRAAVQQEPRERPGDRDRERQGRRGRGRDRRHPAARLAHGPGKSDARDGKRQPRRLDPRRTGRRRGAPELPGPDQPPVSLLDFS